MGDLSFLIGESGHPRENANERLFAFLAYSDDPASMKQLFELCCAERSRREKEGRDYQQSALAGVVERHLVKSEAQRAVAGLVTLVFYFAAISGRDDISLYRAAQLAEKMLAENRSNEGKTFEVTSLEWVGNHPVGDPVALRAAASRSDIERRFRRYVGISPLTAAMLAEDSTYSFSADTSEIVKSRAWDNHAFDLLAIAGSIEATVTTTFPKHFDSPLGLSRMLELLHLKHREVKPPKSLLSHIKNF